MQVGSISCFARVPIALFSTAVRGVVTRSAQAGSQKVFSKREVHNLLIVYQAGTGDTFLLVLRLLVLR